ncbi:MAG: hypothetical protein H5T61_06605 [Thermoflexales bacterium]|nr:hypothetical protein [Thermoflexales bacterium]
MSDRIFADCPHCGKRNTYTRAELEEARPGAKVWRALRSPRPPEPREYVVTCRHCHQPFKVIVRL